MATSTYGTPYVQGSDLVSAYPTVSSSLATRVDEVSYKGNGLNAQTGTTYTLVAGDAGKTITLSNASPVAVTLPQDSTADLPDGAVVVFYNLGAGVVTISQGTGATLQGGSITLAQYEVTSVIKLSANTYGKNDSGGSSGLIPVTPTSIANSGGTASLSGGAVTFSGVTTVSVNGCFISAYSNYRILIENVTADTLRTVRMRYRAAGSDDATTNYKWQYGYDSSTTIGGSRSTGQTSNDIGFASTIAGSTYILDIFQPQAAAVTSGLSTGNYVYSTILDSVRFSTVFGLTTQFDGFTILLSGGTVSGLLRVYGYKN